MPETSLELQASKCDYLYQNIPWWHDVDLQILDELRLEPLTSEQRRQADVVVIGAGIAGLSAALSARQAGADVLVLEAAPGLGRGATGRNAGILSAGINMGLADLDPQGPEARFWPETTRILLDLVAEACQQTSLLKAHLTGAFSLAESANAARVLAREVRARVNLGVRAEIWTARQVAEHTNGRLDTSNVVSAMWLPDEGRIQPLTLLAHLARSAREAGVRIVGNAPVAAYQEHSYAGGAAGWQISLCDGIVLNAEALISAVGPTSQPTARIYALSFAADLPDTFPLFWDALPYTYADYRAGHGRLTVSGGRYGKVGGSLTEARYYQRLANNARHWLPELVHQQPEYQWSVDLEISADMVPHLRELGENAPGLAIEGLGALGVLPGILLGQRGGSLLARVLAQDASSLMWMNKLA
ncbi:MAG TPA: FAD-dependent oxidoreductase [Ktedonobacteraceae bacterium]|nr:FAD-dependent oxidoreductase [Ktedonobacteraceae bacterium]